jgi:molybdopterin converting factor subunit 1
MGITARLFAGVRERAGRQTIEVGGATIADVRASLAEKCPPVAELLASCRFAMNDEFVEDDTRIPDGTTVDVIPPVSGG